MESKVPEEKLNTVYRYGVQAFNISGMVNLRLKGNDPF